MNAFVHAMELAMEILNGYHSYMPLFRRHLCIDDFFSAMFCGFPFTSPKTFTRNVHILVGFDGKGNSSVNSKGFYDPFPFGGASFDNSNPAFGHALERSWGFIFDCSDADLIKESACNNLGICTGPQCLDSHPI